MIHDACIDHLARGARGLKRGARRQGPAGDSRLLVARLPMENVTGAGAPATIPQALIARKTAAQKAAAKAAATRAERLKDKKLANKAFFVNSCQKASKFFEEPDNKNKANWPTGTSTSQTRHPVRMAGGRRRRMWRSCGSTEEEGGMRNEEEEEEG